MCVGGSKQLLVSHVVNYDDNRAQGNHKLAKHSCSSQNFAFFSVKHLIYRWFGFYPPPPSGDIHPR